MPNRANTGVHLENSRTKEKHQSFDLAEVWRRVFEDLEFYQFDDFVYMFKGSCVCNQDESVIKELFNQNN